MEERVARDHGGELSASGRGRCVLAAVNGVWGSCTAGKTGVPSVGKDGLGRRSVKKTLYVGREGGGWQGVVIKEAGRVLMGWVYDAAWLRL